MHNKILNLIEVNPGATLIRTPDGYRLENFSDGVLSQYTFKCEHTVECDRLSEEHFNRIIKEDALRQLISVSIELNEVKAESRNCRCINKKKDLVARYEELSRRVQDLTARVLN